MNRDPRFEELDRKIAASQRRDRWLASRNRRAPEPPDTSTYFDPPPPPLPPEGPWCEWYRCFLQHLAETWNPKLNEQRAAERKLSR